LRWSRSGPAFGWGDLPVAGFAGSRVWGGGELPAGFVDEVVVAVAEQDRVRDVGAAAVFPVGDVVGVAAVGGHGAVRELAVPVAELEGLAQSWGCGPGGASDVEDLAGRVVQPARGLRPGLVTGLCP
jgi:hypothetical protein